MINLVANLCPANVAFGYLRSCTVYTADGHIQKEHVRLSRSEKVVACCIWILKLAKK